MPDPLDYFRQIEPGKEIVTQYIIMRPGSAHQTYTMRWLPQDADEHDANVHRPEIFLGDRRRRIFFPEAELADASGTLEAEGALKRRVGRFFEGLTASKGKS